MALVAVVKHDDGGEEIVGGGRYVMLQPGRAEAAFTVVDHHQGRGPGTVLLRHLAAIAGGAGIHEFVAEVLPDNTPMLVVPDLEAGNMLAKNLTFLAKAVAAGMVLGVRVPIILTSRAASVRSRMASCAVAVLYADAGARLRHRRQREIDGQHSCRQCGLLQRQVRAVCGGSRAGLDAAHRRQLRALRQEPSAGLKIVQLGRIASPSISRLAR